MEKYYFDLGVYGKKVQGHHIIKAESEERVLEIREKHGISNPRFAKGKLNISCNILNMAFKHVQELILRRQKGIGGSVWYEDENGNLQTETK